ncbi:TPA: hypothetical protein JLG68_001377 [Escherichia coli]|nr:hypothetical protein [Escherichia coli]
MKADLVKLLETLSKDDVFIVRKMDFRSIKQGQEVFIDGQWRSYIWGCKERKLYHIRYVALGCEFHGLHIVRSPYLLVKVEP